MLQNICTALRKHLSAKKMAVHVRNLVNALAIIENTASSLALPWIELAATRLAKTKEPIELQGFRSEPWVYNLTRERVC